MIADTDGYSIRYNRAANRIVITLPQTWETLTNTVALFRNRKVDIGDADLALILVAVKAVCETR